MTESAPDELPHDHEWRDVGGGVETTSPRQLLIHADGTTKLGLWWRHTRPDSGRCHGPAMILFGEPHHTLVADDPLTITPSILCPATIGCGRHGYVSAGQWVEA